MTQREMFEKSFQRPTNYFHLSMERQWEIDKDLGILDWDGSDLTDEDRERYNKHYNIKTVKKSWDRKQLQKLLMDFSYDIQQGKYGGASTHKHIVSLFMKEHNI